MIDGFGVPGRSREQVGMALREPARFIVVPRRTRIAHLHRPWRAIYTARARKRSTCSAFVAKARGWHRRQAMHQPFMEPSSLARAFGRVERGREQPSRSDWTLISGSEARCVPFAPDHRLLCDYADIAAFIRICDRRAGGYPSASLRLPSDASSP